MVCIGIDLGTTYSCVAIVKDGRPTAIHNDYGKTKKLNKYSMNFTLLISGTVAT